MTDREFDLLLQEDLSDLPLVPDLTREINPWRKAFYRILWGLALNNITLHFLMLQYILPTLGVILLLLGFRTLRRENGYFKAGWVLTVIIGVHRLLSLAVGATIWNGAITASALCQVLNYVVFAVTLAQILCLRAGLRAVQRKAGLEPRTGPATALAIWYFLILPLSLLSELGSLPGILMLIVYVCIIVCLRKLARVPEESGYAVNASPVRLSDGRFAALCCILLALLLATGWIFFRRYPMEFTPVQETTQEEAIADLSELAIPEHILRDLTDEDLAACMGAEQMVISEEEREFENGDVLQITGLALNLSDGKTWKYIHHFQWKNTPKHYGTEAIQLWTTSHLIEGWYDSGDLTGQVLYDQNGTTYTSPYFSLGALSQADQITSSGFWNPTDPIASFSFPKGGENYRCYVAYDAVLSAYGRLAESWANYIHQLSFLQYPVQTAELYVTQYSMFSREIAFEYDQWQLLFYPQEDGTAKSYGGAKWRDRGPEPEGWDSGWYQGETE